MSTFNTSMFQSIKDALNKNDSDSPQGIYNEVMKTSPGNTYRSICSSPVSHDLW
jgi:hypothetical protein